MGLVRNCRDFDRIWNERLDDRTGGEDSPDRTAALDDHAARCEACRCRALIYLELETLSSPWSVIPPPSAAAVDRWQAAAVAVRPLTVNFPPAGRRSRWVGIASKAGLAASVAASILIGSRALLPILYPIEPAPLLRTDKPSRLFEEAFTEATTMTWELAREVSGPAARISSEALGWTDHRALPPFMSTQHDLTETSVPIQVESPRATHPAGVELISGSARHAFRFLIGTTSDDPPESAEAAGR